MIQLMQITYESSEITLDYTRTHSDSTDTLIFKNLCGDHVAELSLLSYRDGQGKFRINNDIHVLPFGRYTMMLMSDKCCCGVFPLEIPKCSATGRTIADRLNELHCNDEELPKRECTDSCCDCGCECEDKCCDECTGCHGINPCDKCHPCYTDRVENVRGRFVHEESIDEYTDEAKEALFK